ncbi:hypothetical protein [Desertimonas flava]|nr:hypothetical protein [Desertimonas flava]
MTPVGPALRAVTHLDWRERHHVGRRLTLRRLARPFREVER